MSRNVKNSQATRVVEPVLLTGQQEQVISLLLAGKTQAAAASEVGVAAETVTRWITGDPSFVAGYNLRRLEVWEANCARLRELSTKAVETIADILDHGENSGIRLRAALAILKDLGMVDGPAAEVTPEDVQAGWEWADLQKRATGWGL